MLRIFMVCLSIMVGASMAVAETPQFDTTGLTSAQIAELVIQAEKMKTKPGATTIETLTEYGEFGKAFGSAIAETAKEVGTTANEFITTPAGKVAVALIVWKVAGDDIMGIILGTAWFLLMIPLWVIFFRKIVTQTRYNEKVEIGVNNTKIKTRELADKEMQERADIGALWMMFIFFVICICGFVIY